MTDAPKIIMDWPTPWYIHPDGIKSSDGRWIMSVMNYDLALRIVELANFAGTLLPLARHAAEETLEPVNDQVAAAEPGISPDKTDALTEAQEIAEAARKMVRNTVDAIAVEDLVRRRVAAAIGSAVATKEAELDAARLDALKVGDQMLAEKFRADNLSAALAKKEAVQEQLKDGLVDMHRELSTAEARLAKARKAIGKAVDPTAHGVGGIESAEDHVQIMHSTLGAVSGDSETLGREVTSRRETCPFCGGRMKAGSASSVLNARNGHLIEVKPMEWVEDTHICYARTTIGTYVIYITRHDGGRFAHAAFDGVKFHSLEAAKAAAQGDYETRIISDWTTGN